MSGSLNEFIIAEYQIHAPDDFDERLALDVSIEDPD
jgi:hypothetical protein